MNDPLAQSISWLRQHEELLRPDVWAQHFPPLDVPTQTIVEALLLSRCLSRNGRQDAQELVEGLETLALEALESTVKPADMDRLDEQTVYRLWPVALLGDRAPRPLAERAREVFANAGGSLVRLDAPPTAAIEAAYVGWLGDWAPDLPGFAALRPHGYRDADPGRLDEAEMYALTHDLLYATDFGGEVLQASPPVRAEVATLLDTLLGRVIVEQHWDLTAELLACAIAVGASDVAAIAGRLLAGAQLPSGAVPGPPYDAEVAAGRAGAQKIAYEFRTCYHATLVATMAWTALGGTVAPMSLGDAREADQLRPGRVAAALSADDLAAATREARYLRPDHPAARACRLRQESYPSDHAPVQEPA